MTDDANQDAGRAEDRQGQEAVYHVERSSLRGRRYLFLGEAVEWIISRGERVAYSLGDYRGQDPEGAAEQELFDRLDAASKPHVEGYRFDQPRSYESLPLGIWARMNRGGFNDPTFTPVDDVEGRDDGGCVRFGDKQWNGVRLPTAFVLKHWPPTARQARKSSGRRPAYAWPKFDEAARAKLEHEGDIDPAADPKWKKAGLEEFMAEWCRKNWGTEPAESTIRKRLTAVINDFRRSGQGR